MVLYIDVDVVTSIIDLFSVVWTSKAMLRENQQINLNRDRLLHSIRDRLLDGDTRALKPSEVVQLLEWIVATDDTRQREELLKLFTSLGGLDLVRMSMSDFM